MLDVIITSSCRKTLIKTIPSFLEKVKYTGKFRFIINIDVLNPKNLPLLKKYLKKVQTSNKVAVDVRVNANPAKNCYEAHAKAVSYLFSRIETPYYFHLEDDWIFLKELDLNPIVRLMKKYSYIDYIRLSRKKIMDKSWLYHLSDEITDEYLTPNFEVVIDGISLVQIPTWSFNPHLGRTSVIKNFTDLQIKENPEKYICHKHPGISNSGKLYMYGKIGDGAFVEDSGRSKIGEKIRKIKYIIRGGKYAEYGFG